jgi:hypothetical protein
MTLDHAHKIILSYGSDVGNDDWKEAIERIKVARQDEAFDKAFEGDQTVSRNNAKYYFEKGVEYATQANT